MGQHPAAVETHADVRIGTHKSGVSGAASAQWVSLLFKLQKADLVTMAGKATVCRPNYC